MIRRRVRQPSQASLHGDFKFLGRAPIGSPMGSQLALDERRGRTRVLITLVVVAISTLIIIATASQHGTATALIAVGPESPAHPIVTRDMPNAFEFAGTGLDGALFYAIARNPTDVKVAARSLDYPTYRLRRILYPLVGGTIAPGGGLPLIYTLAMLSILGTAFGAWWLGTYPGAPPWLPLLAIINPGIILSLSLTLSDALATGLVLAAFGAMFRRRVWLAVFLLVLACLTRETSVVAAFALAAWPGLSMCKRLSLAIVPTVPIAAWSLFVAHTLGTSIFQQPAAGTFSLPLVGWVKAGFSAPDIGVPLVGAILIIAALTKWRRSPLPVTIYLAVTLAMLICSAPIIASEWFGTSRVMAAAVPLAAWVVARRPRRADRTLQLATP